MERILESKVEYLPPPAESLNMAQELLAAFRRHSDRTLLVDSAKGRSWTGRQLLRAAGSIATGLNQQVGLKPGQVVFMLTDHSDDEILMVLGIMLAGGAVFGTCPSDSLAEIRTLCELELPQVLVTNSRLHRQTTELRKCVAGLEKAPLIWLDDPCKQISQQQHGADLNGNFAADIDTDIDSNNNNSDSAYWNELIERNQIVLHTDLINGHFDEQLVDQLASKCIDSREHILTLMLTSGSTGKPKVVASTHEELIHGLYSMISATKQPLPSGQLLLPLNEGSVLAGDLPLDHGAGFNIMLLSFSLGSKFIVMPAYDEDTFLRAVHDYRISASIASTTSAFKLLTRLKTLIDSGEHRRLDLSCFEYLSCVGSKMAFGELAHEINKTYRHLYVTQGYGATEVGFMTMLSAGDCRGHLSSVGHLFPGVSAKVVGAEGQVLGPDERGELHVWSRSKFKLYKCHRDEDPQRLLELCHDQQGFYRTGDQVHYDHEGRLYVHGRFKDTLFLGQDWKILPSELEELVDQHPLVEQSAVLGIPDPELPGCHLPKAFVRLISRESAKFDKLAREAATSEQAKSLIRRLEFGDRKFLVGHLYQFVAEQTSQVKHLRGGIVILDEFPRIGLLNKIDRKALRLIC